jgi:protease I
MDMGEALSVQKVSAFNLSTLNPVPAPGYTAPEIRRLERSCTDAVGSGPLCARSRTMTAPLSGKTIAVLATDGFEQVELDKPVAALKTAGAEVHIVAPEAGEIQGFNHHDKGDRVAVDRVLADVSASDYDGLVLPGGVINPDTLRLEEAAIGFIRGFTEASKPVAAICHGPWPLIDADAVKGRKVTSWPSLKADLTNAGARWVDEEVVVDNGLVTSRNPDDLPAFCKKMIEEFTEGRHVA